MNAQDKKILHLEYRTAAVIFILGLFLRVFYVFRYDFDTDEPQHLHIVWAWLQGLLPYRDVFDNHTPLFHVLCAPFLYIIGERYDALYFMRLFMILFFIATMICAYIIACNLFSKRAGFWSAALAGIYPAFFFCSLQFRADVLWMVLWIAGLAVFLGKTPGPKRFFWAGFLFGSDLCASNKTTLLLISLILAVILIVLSDLKYYKIFLRGNLIKLSFSFLIGFLIMPALAVGYFAWEHALGHFIYCTISHNILPGIGHWKEIWRILLFVISLFVLLVINKNYLQKHGITKSALILFLTVILYFLSLFSFWPVVTRQDFLPIYSLAAILIISLLLRLVDFLKAMQTNKYLAEYYSIFILVFIAVFEIIVIFIYAPPWKDETLEEVSKIKEVLKLTNRNDLVMDQKGETVYRNRPFYYALESFTKERMRRGIIPDTISGILISKRCCVVTNDISRFPWYSKDFIEEHYISVGYMRVAGEFLKPSHKDHNVFQFEVYIPADYVIIGQSGNVTGILDGLPYTWPIFLEAGPHEFVLKDETPAIRTSAGRRKIALVWSQAVERGFSPFLPRP